MKDKKAAFILMLAVFIVCAVSFDIFAAGRVKASGTLTSIEDDGSVLINGHGYEVDHSVKVTDKMRKNISLRSLSVPVKVNFEYEYTKRGFVITHIEESPEEVPQ